MTFFDIDFDPSLDFDFLQPEEVSERTRCYHAPTQNKMEEKIAELRRELTEVHDTLQHATATRKNGELLDVPYFHGDFGDDFEELSELQELLARAEELTEAQKLVKLPAYLRGNALEVYRDLPDDTEQDYELLSTALDRAFKIPARELSNSEELHRRHQKAYESVATYACELQKLGRAAYPNMHLGAREEMLRGYFLAGLKGDIQDRMSYLPTSPANFDAAVAEAKRQEVLLARKEEQAKEEGKNEAKGRQKE